MPEGHTLHRIARRHDALFSGSPVAVSSPQGRFAAGAAQLDGSVLESVAAHGKHLFYRWRDAPSLYVHLGLVGVFRTWDRSDPPPPSAGTRMMFTTDIATAHLAGPMTCRLLDDGEEDAIVGELGPDPIMSRRGRREFARRLARKRVPVAAALLDQRVVAGIGNVYRAELLFLTGVHPATPAHRLDAATVDALWDLTVDELRRGVELGHIVTVRPREAGVRSRRRLPREEALYVYKREGDPCRRCGTEIRSADIGARRTWWCPTCQPR